MKKVWALCFAGALALASAAIAQEQNPKRPPNSQSQGSEAIQSLKGTVVSVDTTGKSFMLRDESGRQSTIYWDSSTELKGGPPKEGQSVELSGVNRDGKLVASTIQVVAAEKSR